MSGIVHSCSHTRTPVTNRFADTADVLEGVHRDDDVAHIPVRGRKKGRGRIEQRAQEPTKDHIGHWLLWLVAGAVRRGSRVDNLLLEAVLEQTEDAVLGQLLHVTHVVAARTGQLRLEGDRITLLI